MFFGLPEPSGQDQRFAQLGSRAKEAEANAALAQCAAQCASIRPADNAGGSSCFNVPDRCGGGSSKPAVRATYAWNRSDISRTRCAYSAILRLLVGRCSSGTRSSTQATVWGAAPSAGRTQDRSRAPWRPSACPNAVTQYARSWDSRGRLRAHHYRKFQERLLSNIR